ncbi:hypothetical protein ABW19_dt0200537 [Dactylella cylindrospora]|nr:hypothetical protein ABW19_dt0200537 [Dactylella cylindrospora]
MIPQAQSSSDGGSSSRGLIDELQGELSTRLLTDTSQPAGTSSSSLTSGTPVTISSPTTTGHTSSAPTLGSADSPASTKPASTASGPDTTPIPTTLATSTLTRITGLPTVDLGYDSTITGSYPVTNVPSSLFGGHTISDILTFTRSAPPPAHTVLFAGGGPHKQIYLKYGEIREDRDFKYLKEVIEDAERRYPAEKEGLRCTADYRTQAYLPGTDKDGWLESKIVACKEKFSIRLANHRRGPGLTIFCKEIISMAKETFNELEKRTIRIGTAHNVESNEYRLLTTTFWGEDSTWEVKFGYEKNGCPEDDHGGTRGEWISVHTAEQYDELVESGSWDGYWRHLDDLWEESQRDKGAEGGEGGEGVGAEKRGEGGEGGEEGEGGEQPPDESGWTKDWVDVFTSI